MLIECILLSSSFCHTVNAKPPGTDGTKKEHTVVSMLKDRPLMMLMATDLTAKTLDYTQTQRDFTQGGFYEQNPVLRPMLGHPAAMYAYGAAYAFGAAWVGHKMRTSHLTAVRKLWWLPQTVSIGQNAWGYAYTRAHYRR